MKLKSIILCGLCLLQIIFLYNCNDNNNKPLIGVLLFITQFSIGLLSYLFFKHKIPAVKRKGMSSGILLIAMSIITILLFLEINFGNNLVYFKPVSEVGSDVIPQIDSLCTRFNAHQFPYRLIHFQGYNMNPTYLPMQWFPYCPAVLLHIDIRTFSFILYAIAVFFVCFFYLKNAVFTQNKIVSLFLIGSLLYIPVALIQNKLIYPTVEQGIASLYLLIPIFIAMKKYAWASFFICLCLLSRYSIIFWVPLYFIILYLHKPKLAFQQFAIIAVGVVAIYVLPFLSRDWSIFLKGYQYHSGAALGEWEHLNDNNQPCHLYDGQGFAFIFYALKNMALESRLQLLQKVHLIVSGGFILLSGIYYIKKRTTISKELFMISSLLIYIVLFYSFIQIPYKYLFIVPCTLIITSLMSIQMLRGEGE